MNVVFVTRRSHSISSQIPILTPEQGREIILKWTHSKIFHDIETSGKDPFKNIVLLEAWWSGVESDPIMVIDSTSVRVGEVVDNQYLKDKIIVAHNADFEARFNIVRGLIEGEYLCTMVTQQTLLCGMEGVLHNIVDTLKIHKIEIPEVMNKDIRNEFIGADESMDFEDKHVLYNAGDILKLPDLIAKQQIQIDKFGMNFLIHHLRAPLVKELAKAEVTGLVHDAERWLAIAERERLKAKDIAYKLNKYLTDHGIDIFTINPDLRTARQQHDAQLDKNRARIEKLSASLNQLEAKKKTGIKAYTTQKEQLAKCLSFVPNPIPPSEVNWASPYQPIAAIKSLGMPVPMAKDKESFSMKEGVSKDARANWFAEHSSHPHIEFMKLLDQYKNTEHNVKSFGEAWVERYTHPITGKVHTIFRQAGARTGRFASGAKDDGYFNFQQIPKRKNERKIAEYRECFGTDPGRMMAVLDFIGCELVCMISLANDLELKRISDLPDQHSYLGTKCWRAIFRYRYDRGGSEEDLRLATEYVMTKEGNARDKFKRSGAFPVVYGVSASKVATIQGFSVPEGQIFIDTIEGEMPNVIAFVKSCAAHAVRHGFVVHNKRTNSRRWFRKALGSKPLTRGEKAQIETAARNSPIQGTNIDIIIEAIVTIARWARLYKVDVRLLGQVHDELIYDFPEGQEWILDKLKQLMKRAAKRYLISEIDMDVDGHCGLNWAA